MKTFVKTPNPLVRRIFILFDRSQERAILGPETRGYPHIGFPLFLLYFIIGLHHFPMPLKEVGE